MEESGTTKYSSVEDDDDDDANRPITSTYLEIESSTEREKQQPRATTPASVGGGGPGAAVISAAEAETESDQHPMSGIISFVNGVASMLGMKGSAPIGYDKTVNILNNNDYPILRFCFFINFYVKPFLVLFY